MPTPTSTRWVDTLMQRVDRIRRAQNLCELQRTIYLLAAAVLAGATALLITALFGSTRLFAVLAWSTLGAFAVTTGLLVREAIGRWLSRDQAIIWIENHAALRGRLRSLVELDARGEQTGTRFFLPLLAAENAHALPSWEPNRIVRRRVPRVALASAFISAFALLAALTLSPVLYPRVPALAGTNASGSSPGSRGLGTGSHADDARSPLARLPAELQERIRQTVWGSAWDRVREAIAKTDRDNQRYTQNEASDGPGSEEDTDGPWQLADRGPQNERPPGEGLRRREESTAEREASAPPPRRALERSASTTPQEGQVGSGGGAGAGSSTSPDLYGAAAPTNLASHARFELGLVTRMQLKHRHGEPGAAAPPRARDQDPRLTVSDRREDLGYEMAVPRAYEPIVRQVFAHRDAEGIE